MQVNMFDAKSQLSKLVKAALAGDEVVIANKGVPVVKLVPVTAANPKRKPGAWAHLCLSEKKMKDAFSPKMDAEIADALYKSALGRPKAKKAARK